MRSISTTIAFLFFILLSLNSLAGYLVALPTVTTDAISGISVNSATTGGEVTSDGGDAVTERGIVYGLATGPTISGSRTSDGGTGTFVSTLTSLSPNTTYYYRAYATNSTGTEYGAEISFITSPPSSRTWVSGVGDDINPCTRTAPCKTFQGAYVNTATGGEINVLDPGGFGSLNIMKSITINGGGILGSIVFTGTNAISINASTTDIINIRNLSLQGGGTTPGFNGVIFNTAGQVNIENCTIQNFTTTGVSVPSSSSGGVLSINNCTITSSSTNAKGIDISSSSGTVTASINHVLIQTKSVGINASTNSVATASNSIINQSATGIKAINNGVINLEACTISNNTTGAVSTDAASIVRLSNCSIYSNGTGVNGTGKVISLGNNIINGNTTNSAVPLSVLKQQ